MSQLPCANTKIDKLADLERHFRRSKFLHIALTHKSCDSGIDNERLEFLGDSVLELIVRKALLDEYPGATEGELTRMKIDLVRKASLVRAADRLKLRDRIVTGIDFGEGGIPDSLAADAYEAVIGALFLDSGLGVVTNFVKSTLISFEKISTLADSKTSLQEFCQANKLALPVYRLEKVTGPSHAPIFDINVVVNNAMLGFGRALSKKKAQEIAATVALRALERKNVYGL